MSPSDKDVTMNAHFLLLVVPLLAIGCGQGIARLDQLSRVQAAVLTDATSLGGDANGVARPPVQVTDPDRLLALENFLKARRSSLKATKKSPRPTRFQLELMASDRPLYTIWLEPGYMAVGSGKSFREARLSNAETTELLACLGLPGDYLSSYPSGSPVTPAAYPPPGYDPRQQTIIPAGGETTAPNPPGAARL